MADEQIGRKPTPEQVEMAEADKRKPAPPDPDVQAQRGHRVCRCYGCGAANLVQPWWDRFWCRWCGTLNWTR